MTSEKTTGRFDLFVRDVSTYRYLLNDKVVSLNRDILCAYVESLLDDERGRVKVDVEISPDYNLRKERRVFVGTYATIKYDNYFVINCRTKENLQRILERNPCVSDHPEKCPKCGAGGTQSNEEDLIRSIKMTSVEETSFSFNPSSSSLRDSLRGGNTSVKKMSATETSNTCTTCQSGCITMWKFPALQKDMSGALISKHAYVLRSLEIDSPDMLYDALSGGRHMYHECNDTGDDNIAAPTIGKAADSLGGAGFDEMFRIMIPGDLRPDSSNSHPRFDKMMRSAFELLNIVKCPARKTRSFFQTNPSWSLLHHASVRNAEKCVRVLLNRHGHSVSARDKIGMTPLHHAVFNEASKVVKLLLEKGADSNVVTHRGFRPLHLSPSCDSVKLLLEAGACCSHRVDDGSTSLHFAMRAGHFNAANLLLTADISLLEKEDRMNWTPLHYAIDAKKIESILFLLSEGALPRKDRNGWDPRALCFSHFLEYKTVSGHKEDASKPEKRSESLKLVQMTLKYPKAIVLSVSYFFGIYEKIAPLLRCLGASGSMWSLMLVQYVGARFFENEFKRENARLASQRVAHSSRIRHRRILRTKRGRRGKTTASSKSSSKEPKNDEPKDDELKGASTLGATTRSLQCTGTNKSTGDVISSAVL